MQSKTFPKSGLTYTLLGAGPPSLRFSSILRHAATDRPASRMASVNAGDPGLYVGGGTINLAFSGEIDDPDAYTLIHKQALMSARLGHGPKTGFPATAPVRLVQVTRGATDPARGGVGAGTVFLDVFASPPHGVAENAAMVYLVPPNGATIPDPKDFLAAVATATANVAASVAAYNAAVARGDSAYAGMEPLTDLRTCLFSGGQFRHPSVDVDDVARTIFDALDTALAADAGGLDLVEFESGTGEFAAIA
ncbi:hypothetical protein HKCCE2091_16630 [Rhodobacterales bacterium HKCCE2091]|nr:hypothetical protein [Rhodobacterales bacterium HKCCE2091]